MKLTLEQVHGYIAEIELGDVSARWRLEQKLRPLLRHTKKNSKERARILKILRASWNRNNFIEGSIIPGVRVEMSEAPPLGIVNPTAWRLR